MTRVKGSTFDANVVAPTDHEIFMRFSNGEKAVPVTMRNGERATLVRHTMDVLDPPGGHLFPEDPYFRAGSDWLPTRVQTTILVFDGGAGGPAALEAAARVAMTSY